jgi:hypothetical protein
MIAYPCTIRKFMMQTSLTNTQQTSVNLMPSAQEWKMMVDQASVLVKSGFLPDSVKTPEQAITIMLKGREVGMPPMQAFAQINVIKGKPTIGAEGMLALILKAHPSVKFEYTVNTNEACEMKIARPGNSQCTFKYTIDDATKAGLMSKDNWKKNPRAMLRSRCISEMSRSIFPDALMGISFTPEEMEDALVVVTPEVLPEESPFKEQLKVAMDSSEGLWGQGDVKRYFFKKFEALWPPTQDAQWLDIISVVESGVDPRDVV